MKNQPDLRAFVAALVRDRALADDIIQDVALISWDKFGEYDPERSFGAWAKGIAANRIMQEWDRRRRGSIFFSSAAVEAVLDRYAQTEKREEFRRGALEGCMEKLPSDGRRMLDLRYRNRLSLRELAVLMNLGIEAVGKRLSRIRIQLRECVERRMAESGEIG